MWTSVNMGAAALLVVSSLLPMDRSEISGVVPKPEVQVVEAPPAPAADSSSKTHILFVGFPDGGGVRLASERDVTTARGACAALERDADQSIHHELFYGRLWPAISQAVDGGGGTVSWGNQTFTIRRGHAYGLAVEPVFGFGDQPEIRRIAIQDVTSARVAKPLISPYEDRGDGRLWG